MKSSGLLFLSFLMFMFVISCTEEDPEIIDEVDPLTYSEGTITIDGVSELEFSALTVLSIDSSVQVEEDGSFRVHQEPNETEELPILFTSNGEVLFGYFKEPDTDSIIDIDDILLFYFSLHPEMAIETPDKTDLKRAIVESIKYEDIKAFVSTSLSASQSPFDDEEFLDLFSKTGYSIINGMRAKTKSKSADDDTFQFSHSRGGLITWPKRFPLFAYVGMEIADEKGVVFGSHIFDRARLVLSPNSLKDWLYDYFIKSDKDKKESFQLPANGTYRITISNGVDGVGTVAFEEAIDKRNRFELGADVLATLLPLGLKTFLKDDCKEDLTKLFTNQKIEPLRLMGGKQFELEKFLKGLQEDAFGVIVSCMTSKEITYADYIKSITKKLSLVEDLATLSFFIRDYSWSNISTNEVRYFYDGVSYGGLTYTNVSGDYLTNGGVGKKEFSGPKGSEHIYQAMVSEDIFSYGLNREFKSTLNQYTKQEGVGELKFDIERLTGDAEVKEDPSKHVFKEEETKYSTFTDAKGQLSFSVVMGEEDSEMEIKPTFKSIGINKEELISFKEVKFLEGKWLVKYFDRPSSGQDHFEEELWEEWKFTFGDKGGATKAEWRNVRNNGDWSNYSGSWSIGMSMQYISIYGRGGPYSFRFTSYEDKVFHGQKFEDRIELHKLE